MERLFRHVRLLSALVTLGGAALLDAQSPNPPSRSCNCEEALEFWDDATGDCSGAGSPPDVYCVSNWGCFVDDLDHVHVQWTCYYEESGQCNYSKNGPQECA